MKKSTNKNQIYFRFELIDESTNSSGEVVLGNIEASPLTLEQWHEYKEFNRLEILISGVIIEKPDFAHGIPPPGKTFKKLFPIEPYVENSFFALVCGGWIPIFFTLANGHLILDRNVISEFKARFIHGELKNNIHIKKDFVDHLTYKNSFCTLHTLAYSLEGNSARFPTNQEIIDEHVKASAIITKALPHIKIWPEIDSDLNHFSISISKYKNYFEEGMRFLVLAAPKLMRATSKEARPSMWKELADIAESQKMSFTHIAFLACISASTAHQTFNPAKNLIKPSPNYSEANAYNSMFDLFLIVLAKKMQHEFPQKNISLISRDKNLALLWMGLYLKSDLINGEDLIGFHKCLLPISQDETEQLSTIFGKKNIQFNFLKSQDC